ncbi:hypothetical protein MTR67_034790 [Solanum verrucosum]|uniref:Reverse transcriptase domain-containing protein n=1 Tax=Solanum verrucosum TaxID=315347 RepID=A0AAF0ZKU7_SOLVR|nr:hypothetical protein MTR67_034790 [Solanum verrucosum]
MDNILFWNVRGLNGPNKKKEVQLLCNGEAVGLVGLAKNKNKKTLTGLKGFGKIDWVFIKNDWLTQIPDYIANFLPEGIRYHSPVTPVKIESLHVIARSVLQLLSNREQLKQINFTIISLILKVPNHQYASQFRPISCCNVLYKPMSKVICVRLGKPISHLVAENQAGFVAGRSLVHGILICHDLLRHYNRKTSPRCLMKIDLRKAYDMLNWEFLEEALNVYGFPTSFIQLVMTCITTTKLTIKVNREGYGYFEWRRGLGQGNPISPLLFVLVMKYLARTLKKMTEFLDFRGDCSSIARVMKAINHFSDATGLVDDVDKSKIFLEGIDDTTQAGILFSIGFSLK